VRDGRVFLLRRANTGYCDGLWCFPSGHVEAGETPQAAAVREAREEVGVEIDPEDAASAATMYRISRRASGGDRTTVDFLFVVRRFAGEPRNAEPAKASEGAWCDLGALPGDMIEAQQILWSSYLERVPFLPFEEALP